jgi:protein-S-isoprenylcysteine O-methyltransferase Ste14
MRLDIRIPVGLLFVVVGALLTVFGVTSDSALYNRSLNINVNLWWGAVLLVFGVVMFALGRRSHRAKDTGASTSVAARKGASEQQ